MMTMMMMRFAAAAATPRSCRHLGLAVRHARRVSSSSSCCWRWRTAPSVARSGPRPRWGFLPNLSSSSASASASFDSPMMQAMEKKIKEQLEADIVSVKDAYGDGRHVSIDVVSKLFEGKSPVNRQRMVYKAIWEELQSAVHAVDQMTTKTPAEVAADK